MARRYSNTSLSPARETGARLDNPTPFHRLASSRSHCRPLRDRALNPADKLCGFVAAQHPPNGVWRDRSCGVAVELVALTVWHPCVRALNSCTIPGLQGAWGIQDQGAKQAAEKIAIREPETRHLGNLELQGRTASVRRRGPERSLLPGTPPGARPRPKGALAKVSEDSTTNTQFKCDIAKKRPAQRFMEPLQCKAKQAAPRVYGRERQYKSSDCHKSPPRWADG